MINLTGIQFLNRSKLYHGYFIYAIEKKISFEKVLTQLYKKAILYLKDISIRYKGEGAVKISSKTKYAVLGILTMRPMSGYDIKKAIDSSIAHFWNESFGQLYPALKKMTDEGLVLMANQQQGIKTKIVYSITDRGREILKEWLALSPEKEQIRVESLLKIFFGYNMDIDVTIKHIKEMEENFKLQRAVLKGIIKEIEGYRDEKHSHIFPILTAEYGVMYYETCLKWTAHAIEKLEKEKKGELI